jgi:hypothetical protein
MFVTKKTKTKVQDDRIYNEIAPYRRHPSKRFSRAKHLHAVRDFNVNGTNFYNFEVPVANVEVR